VKLQIFQFSIICSLVQPDSKMKLSGSA